LKVSLSAKTAQRFGTLHRHTPSLPFAIFINRLIKQENSNFSDSQLPQTTIFAEFIELDLASPGFVIQIF
jgi:hypothetical protein